MEDALRVLVERTAQEDAVIKYCTAVDRLDDVEDDVEDMLSNFTEDAVLDRAACTCRALSATSRFAASMPRSLPI